MTNNNIVQPKARAIDGIRRPMATTTATMAAVAQPMLPARRKYFRPPQTAKKSHPIWERVQLPLILTVGLIGGYMAQSLLLGLIMLGMYALAATIWRIPSRTTFMLALLFLAGISAMLFLKPSTQLVSNFASYAFVLLMIGVAHLARESRMPKRIRRPGRR